jgi:cytochrome P450
MLKLTQEVFAASDPDMNRSGQTVSAAQMVEDMQATMAELMDYFNAITEDRRRRPRDDIATIIANGQIEGRPIGHFEAMSYYIIVATAGHDTTSNTTAGAMWALAEHPDQFKKLNSDLSLIPGFVEESIRWETPVKHFMRTATADAEVAGQAIAKGDWLMLCYPSGNRDEAAFADPYTFDITRSPNRHVAFGYGAHVCLGQHLARMEMRLFWEELLPRIRSVTLDGPASRWQASFVCGPKTVPLAFEAA